MAKVELSEETKKKVLAQCSEEELRDALKAAEKFKKTMQFGIRDGHRMSETVVVEAIASRVHLEVYNYRGLGGVGFARMTVEEAELLGNHILDAVDWIKDRQEEK